MSNSKETDFIRQMARRRQVKWSIHALAELAVESVTTHDVEAALEHPEILEVYPDQHRFLPDCLVMAIDATGNPLHCVIAINQAQNYILIVTVYRPSPEVWQDDWKTRK
jgi:hypothetical protein